MNNFKKTVLKNGLRIITAPNEGSLAATVLVLVEAGSKYETREINGLSHFLEHMSFKGTKTRPSAFDITSELDAIGAFTNAFTSHEYTGYFAKAEARHLDTVLDVVSDIYLNPIFDPKEINKERAVLIEELNMLEDDPNRKVSDMLFELLYGDQPAGWNIGGTKENINKLDKKDFIKYREDHYLAPATTVIVSGAFNEAETLQKLSDVFDAMPTGKKVEKAKINERQSKPEFMIRNKSLDQTCMILGIRAFDVFDKRRHALEVLAGVLGLGMSSRLFQSIREELSAAYYVSAGVDFYSDHGFMAVSAGIDRKKFDAVMDAIFKELRMLRENLVTPKELERVKNNLAGNFILGLETSDALANFYGSQEIIEKNVVTPTEVVKKIQEVTAEELRDVARAVFRNENLNLALLGPLEKEHDVEKLLKID